MDWAALLVVTLLAATLLGLLLARRRVRGMRERGPRDFRHESAVAEQRPRYRDAKFERDIFDDRETDDEREKNAWR